MIAGKASINCFRRAQSSRSECAGDSEWPGTSEDEKEEDGDGGYGKVVEVDVDVSLDDFYIHCRLVFWK